MKIPFKTHLTFWAFTALLVFQYQNCSSYGDPNPFQVSSELGVKSSAPSDIRMDSPIGSIDVGPDSDSLSAGGECNVGLSTQNYIEVSVRDQNNAEVPIRFDGRGTRFRCEHGRYYIHIPISCAAYSGQPRSLFRLFAQLVTTDATGAEKREKRGAFDRAFEVSWDRCF
jgi:hypothetical protein